MDVAYHLQYWSQTFDPIIWMRVTRFALLIVAGVLMLVEPFQCGGRNKVFHNQIAALFFGMAAYHFVLARNRMSLLRIGNVESIAGASGLETLLVEVFLTLIIISICVKLGYDFYLWRELRRQDRKTSYCNKECQNGYHEGGPQNAIVGR